MKLSKHLVFRIAAIDGKYINAIGENAEKLAEAGRQSALYQFLKLNLDKKKSPERDKIFKAAPVQSQTDEKKSTVASPDHQEASQDIVRWVLQQH